jgi:arylsulfatase A-like enzyme
MLQENGYSTAGIGKWHLGLGQAEKVDYGQELTPNPQSFGFDYYFGIPASLDMEPYLYFENGRAVAEPTEHVEKSLHRRENGGGFWREGPIAPGFRHEDVLPVITDKAVEFLQDAARHPEKPFFLYWALTAPHTPWLPSTEFQGISDAGYYGDFCAQVDWSVGRLLTELDNLGFSENTIVIFTSDNGSHWPVEDIEKFKHKANLDFRGQKADIWEGGHRVPFIARWPGMIQAGSESSQTTCHTDLFATISSIIGRELKPGEGEDSFDLLPVLLNPESGKSLREATVHHSNLGVFAIRKGDWKLIQGRGSGGFTQPQTVEPQEGEPIGQLYDLSADPSEARNLYLQNPEKVEELSVLLERYMEQGASRLSKQ